MSKLLQKDISDILFSDYLDDKEYISNAEEIKGLDLLVDNKLAYKIVGRYDTMDYYDIMYFILSKFMMKMNPDLKQFKRTKPPYEKDDDFVTSKMDEKIQKLFQKDGLDIGLYYAVDKKEKTYFVFYVYNKNSEDLTEIDYSFYIVGKRFLKYKEKLLKKYGEYYNLRKKESVERLFFSNSTPPKYIKFKPFDQMIFKDKERVIKYIDNFIENIPKYEEYNMIPKLSILLYGKPGTGKSTFYKALAKYLGIRSVKIITPDFFSQEFQQMEKDRRPHYSNASAEYITAIDDIDTICKSRQEDTSNENGFILSKLLEFLDSPDSFYFKAKNGLYYKISIIVATTNYYEKLDDAIKRFGRFDLTIEMEYFNKKQAEEMCSIYNLRLEDIYKKPITEDFEISPAELQALCLENLDKNFKRSDSDE